MLEKELSRDFGLPTQLKEMMKQSSSIGESSKGFKGQIEQAKAQGLDQKE